MKSKIHLCSFCGKNETEIFCIITGPMVNICSECVGMCVEIIDEKF